MLPAQNPFMDYPNLVSQPNYDATFGSNMISKDTK